MAAKQVDCGVKNGIGENLVIKGLKKGALFFSKAFFYSVILSN